MTFDSTFWDFWGLNYSTKNVVRYGYSLWRLISNGAGTLSGLIGVYYHKYVKYISRQSLLGRSIMARLMDSLIIIINLYFN